MSFLVIFTLFASGVTIFGLIVGVFSVYNGRMTRRELVALSRETQEATRQLIRETQELIAREAEATRRILQGITEILGRIDERVR